MKDRVHYVEQVGRSVVISPGMPGRPVTKFGQDEHSVIFVCRNGNVATEMVGLLLTGKEMAKRLDADAIVVVNDILYADMSESYEEDNDDEDYYDEEDYDEE